MNLFSFSLRSSIIISFVENYAFIGFRVDVCGVINRIVDGWHDSVRLSLTQFAVRSRRGMRLHLQFLHSVVVSFVPYLGQNIIIDFFCLINVMVQSFGIFGRIGIRLVVPNCIKALLAVVWFVAVYRFTSVFDGHSLFDGLEDILIVVFGLNG